MTRKFLEFGPHDRLDSVLVHSVHDTINAHRAEVVKLLHRPVILVLAVFVTIPTIWGYLAEYFSYRAMNAQGIHNFGPGSGISMLLPRQLVQNVVINLFDVGPPADMAAIISVVLGAMLVGSEYAWGTRRTALTQAPGRLALFAAQAMAVVVVLGILLLLEYAAAALGSVLVAVITHAAIRPPPSHQLLRSVLTVWLIMAAWGAAGICLATLSRDLTVAMGVGIGWIAVVEGLIQPFGAHSSTVHTLVEWLPRANTDALASALTPAFSAGQPPPSVVIDPTHAAWVLAAYLIGFVTLAGIVFRRCDAP